MSPLRVALVVQGEGRGHLTQALALARILADAGHDLHAVLVGTSPHRQVPAYFFERMPAPVSVFQAPTQVPDEERLGVSVAATARDAVRRMPRFIRSGRAIHRATEGADLVVNFLDFVAGASRLVFRSPAPAVAVAHNYLFEHPELRKAADRPGGRLLRLYTRGTTLRTRARVALSFVPMSDDLRARLHVAPPLLRSGLRSLRPTRGRYLLAYALNPGYGRMLAEWQRRRGDVSVHCYLEGGPRALAAAPGPGFHVHELDSEGFLRHLSGCRAYVGSAGFESLCEAHYLGKPVLAVPTRGQLEQELNAWDAERCRVARAGTYADLDVFWEDPPVPDPAEVRHFRAWVARAPDVLLGVLEAAARQGAAGFAGPRGSRS